jgi:hypothetical protein
VALHIAVVVAMQLAVVQVVDVILVAHGRVAATRPVLVLVLVVHGSSL